MAEHYGLPDLYDDTLRATALGAHVDPIDLTHAYQLSLADARVTLAATNAPPALIETHVAYAQARNHPMQVKRTTVRLAQGNEVVVEQQEWSGPTGVYMVSEGASKLLENTDPTELGETPSRMAINRIAGALIALTKADRQATEHR